MDTTKILADLKKRPGFTENVGMVLVHNGVVRGWARADHAPVKSMKVSHDRAKMDAICREMEQQPGIFCIHAEAVRPSRMRPPAMPFMAMKPIWFSRHFCTSSSSCAPAR